MALIEGGEYCGYILDNKLIVTGMFNENKSDFFPGFKDADFILTDLTFIPKNITPIIGNSIFVNSECLTFILSEIEELGDRTFSCKLSKIKAVCNGQPGFPGKLFAKQITVNESKKMIPTVKKRLAFIETLDTGFVLEKSDIDKRILESLADVYKFYASKNDAICVLNVEPDWLHYDDFLNHGLVEFWDYAFSNKNINCHLVFDKINVTIIQSGLSPLFDVINGIRPTLPFSMNSGVPTNLNLIATVVDSSNLSQLGLPLPRDLFNDWLAYDSKKNSIDIEDIFKKCEKV